MYPPSISYSMYKIEHGVALSDAERSAADRRDALVPSAMARRSRALLRFVIRARLRDGVRLRPARTGRTTTAMTPSTLEPKGSGIASFTTHTLTD
jgi:hypothetical protein